MIISLRKIILLQFWGWYYSGAIKSLIHIWRNFIIFVQEYFSIPLLLKTLFHPWRRDITKYGRGFSVKNFLETLIFNLISRSVGFFARFITIIFGLVCLIGVIILGIIALIIWIVLPIILVLMIISGASSLLGISILNLFLLI